MAAIFGTSSVHGVERITSGTRLYGRVRMSTHAYRVGSTLIDAGAPNRADLVARHALDHGVSTALLTHCHEDHVGASRLLADAGVDVRAPAAGHHILATPQRLPHYRDVTWGAPPVIDAADLAGKVQTSDGTFEVVPTPGHSPDHVALFEPERGWLFSGDAWLGERRELRFDERLDEELSSLRTLAELEPEVLFPGHGSVCTSPVDALQTTVAYYEDLRAAAWRLREKGLSVPGVSRRLLGREGFIRLYTRGEFSKRNLVRQLLWRPPE